MIQRHRSRKKQSHHGRGGGCSAQGSAREALVFGRHPVLDALDSDRSINKLFIQEELGGRQIEEVKARAESENVPYSFVPKSKLDELTDGENHQGVALFASPVAYATLDDLFGVAAAREEDPFFILLDELNDPHNFGSILRTADAVGAHGVITLKHRAVGLTGVVAKASAGSIERVKVARVTNLVDTINELKERGLWIFGTDMTGTDYRRWNTSGPLGLVIGSEGSGMTRLVSENVDEKVTLPMVGGTESLNAGVAAGLLMYEVFRGRHPLA